VSTLAASFISLPHSRYKKSKYFYIWYDGVYFALAAFALSIMYATGHQGFLQTWDWAALAVILPLACYVQITSSVFVHCACHGSFPKAINRLVGEICGTIVLTRFASWEIIHSRHHKFSDDVEKDPHNLLAGYWEFAIHVIKNVEHQLQAIHFDWHGGNTPENLAFEKRRALFSYATNIAVILAWYFFLGPILFFAAFVPAAIVGFLHLIHFNWSTHNPHSPSQNFHPVNLNHGLFKIGNKIWHGIYYHGTHHKKSFLFNPMKGELDAPVLTPAQYSGLEEAP